MGIVEDLENAIDIVELVSKYTSLKKAGANFKSVCPFPGHSEKTPSCVISPSKQLAYCFGCHKGGGPLKFIMDIENCEFKEAIEILGNFTGIKVNSDFNKKEFEIKKSIYSLYKDAVNYYKNSLENNLNIKKYVLDRGLNEQTIKDFHFGYSDSGLNLFNYLKNKGHDDKTIIDSNIFLDIKSKKDKFINRVVFPIQNQRGDFVAFTARIIGEGEPKYLNSPASKIYDKSAILYGLYSARHSITKNDFVIVTEGQMDTISLHGAGFTNTVAISGSALTEKHIQILKKLTKKIYLCFDGDNAGEKATKLSLELLKNIGLEVKIISLPNGKDPDDIINSGKDFGEYIKKALTPIGFYIKKSDFNITSIDEKKRLLDILLSMIKSYSDEIEKDEYIKEISGLLDISKNIIYDKLNRLKFKIEKTPEVIKKVSFSIYDFAIAYIIDDNNLTVLFNEKIIFKEELNISLNKCMEEPDIFYKNLDINKKERLKAVNLVIEEKQENEKAKESSINDLINKINKDSYNKITKKLKILMKENNLEAFAKYSDIIKIARKYNIK